MNDSDAIGCLAVFVLIVILFSLMGLVFTDYCLA